MSEHVVVESSGGLDLTDVIDAFDELRTIDASRDGYGSIKLYAEGGDGTRIVRDGTLVYVRPKWVTHV